MSTCKSWIDTSLGLLTVKGTPWYVELLQSMTRGISAALQLAGQVGCVAHVPVRCVDAASGHHCCMALVKLATLTQLLHVIGLLHSVDEHHASGKANSLVCRIPPGTLHQHLKSQP
jgi:hypothetical protein